MPTISIQQKLLRQLLSRHGLQHDVEKMAHQLPLLGTDIDTCDEQTLDIEIFPDRPDLLSGETLAKAIRPFLHGSKSEPELEVVPEPEDKPVFLPDLCLYKECNK